MEKDKKKKKSERKIIKCKDCGYKYYEGDIHKCMAFKNLENNEEEEDARLIKITRVEKKEDAEETRNKKQESKKATKRESFKMWKV